MNDLSVILSSAVISTVLSVILSAGITYWLKHLEFRNEYYKELIKKRLEAYAPIEQIVADLKRVVFDSEDKKAYHIIFGHGEAGLNNFLSNVSSGLLNSLWMEDATVGYLETLNQILFTALKIISINPNPNTSLVEYGKTYYHDLALLRKDLEVAVRKDLLRLHNFSKIAKNKKPGLRNVEY